MKKTAKRTLAVLLAIMTFISCFGMSVSAEATGFEPLRINCTMYGNSQTQRGFTWYTAGDCDAVIEYVEAALFDVNFTNGVMKRASGVEFEGYYCHKGVVDGLKPGTTYYYRVGSKREGVWSSIGKFVTDNGDGAFSFLTIADVQASSIENFQQAALVMDQAMAVNPNAEFVVNLGDFVNDCTNEEWNWYGEAFERANTNLTLVPVAGNHEGNITNKLNVGWFNTTFNLKGEDGLLNGTNGTFYSFDYGSAHFCVLNTNDMYPMTEAQRNWIINDLTASDAQWKIVLMHKSPYSLGKDAKWPDALYLQKSLTRVVDECGVDLVLSGQLWTYLADLNDQAQERLSLIIDQMKASEGVTEGMKQHDQMAWVGAMNSIRNRAEEIVLREMIYEEDAV